MPINVNKTKVKSHNPTLPRASLLSQAATFTLKRLLLVEKFFGPQTLNSPPVTLPAKTAQKVLVRRTAPKVAKLREDSKINRNPTPVVTSRTDICQPPKTAAKPNAPAKTVKPPFKIPLSVVRPAKNDGDYSKPGPKVPLPAPPPAKATRAERKLSQTPLTRTSISSKASASSEKPPFRVPFHVSPTRISRSASSSTYSGKATVPGKVAVSRPHAQFQARKSGARISALDRTGPSTPSSASSSSSSREASSFFASRIPRFSYPQCYDSLSMTSVSSASSAGSPCPRQKRDTGKKEVKIMGERNRTVDAKTKESPTGSLSATQLRPVKNATQPSDRTPPSPDKRVTASGKENEHESVLSCSPVKRHSQSTVASPLSRETGRSTNLPLTAALVSSSNSPDYITELVETTFGTRKVRRLVIPPMAQGAVASRDVNIQMEIDSLRAQRKVAGGMVAGVVAQVNGKEISLAAQAIIAKVQMRRKGEN